MPIIELTRGFVAQVDDEDFEFLNQWHWVASVNRGRACAVRSPDGALMHRVVALRMGIQTDVYVDHRDCDALNNRRDNLRSATHAENNRNSRKRPQCTSCFKGVYWDRGKWKAQIATDGKQRHLGRFTSEEEAARAYDKAARELFGEFARTNFPL